MTYYKRYSKNPDPEGVSEAQHKTEEGFLNLFFDEIFHKVYC